MTVALITCVKACALCLIIGIVGGIVGYYLIFKKRIKHISTLENIKGNYNDILKKTINAVDLRNQPLSEGGNECPPEDI